MNAKLIPMIIIDSHKGEFWKQIFTDLTLHPHIKVREGGQIAWAMRKNSPQAKGNYQRFHEEASKWDVNGQYPLQALSKEY